MLPGISEVGSLILLRFLAFIGRGQQVREKLQCHRQEELCERYYDENGERNEASEILDGALELGNDVSID